MAADALAAAGVKHVVFSSLMRGTGLPHFDSKVNVADHLRSLGPVTCIYTSAYYSNVLAMLKEEGGELVLAHPLPDDVVMPSFAVEQVGAWVAAAFNSPMAKVYACSQNLTPAIMAKELAAVLGRPVRTNRIARAAFDADTETERVWYASWKAFADGRITNDIEASKAVVPDAWSFGEWARECTALDKWRK